MEGLEAVYTAVAAGIAADTGAGGLANVTGDQYVREVFRETDMRDKATFNKPAVSISVVPREIGHQASGRSMEALFRLKVIADRDLDDDEQDAIVDRAVNLFNGVALSTGSTGWTFSTCTYLRTVQVMDGKFLLPVVEFQVIANK